MTNTTTKEQAVNALRLLTEEHGNEAYFQKADVVYSDGFYGVDMWVNGPEWRARESKIPVPPQIDRVPICVMIHG